MLTLTFSIGEDDMVIPAKYAVCDNCEGKGTQVNPNVDGNGLTQEDFDEQGPDFFDDYMSGVYDIPCLECHGMRVVLVADENRLTDEQKSAYYQHLDEEYSWEQEAYAERMAGC